METSFHYIDYLSLLTVVKNDNTNWKIYLRSHGYNEDPKSICCTSSRVFIVLCCVKSSESLKVVRYSKSGSEIQTIYNDPEGNPLYPMETSSGIAHFVDNHNMTSLYQ